MIRWLKILVAIIGCIAIVFVGAFWYWKGQIGVSHGTETGSVSFFLTKGDGVWAISGRLADAHLIGSREAFLLYVWKENDAHQLKAGEYLLSGAMSIPEIVGKFVRGETVQMGAKITFPEGLTAADMAVRLSENGFSGDDFLSLVKNPKDVWRTQFPFLSILPAGRSLEGFLFPDTYFFDPKKGVDIIIEKMLGNFGEKTAELLHPEADAVRESLINTYGELVLASIVESEVQTSADRKIVADIFFRRLAAGMPLQSDATVKYVLGVSKVQHSAADIAIDSPYNTYKYPGLPPGPVANPGVDALTAVLSPTPNPYWYFLSDPKTKQTFFARDFEEHKRNKAAHGL